MIVCVTFGSKLLSWISKSEIYSFLKHVYATERHRQASDVENTQFNFRSTSVCPWLWSGEMLPAYWPVCEFDLTLHVLFLVAAFNVLITITAYHLPLYQCVAIAFRILVLSVRFIFPQSCSVTLCIG